MPPSSVISETTSSPQAAITTGAPVSNPMPMALPIILAVAVAHLINDLIQAILPAIYPMIKISYGLTFTQIGYITLIFQLTASVLQPAIGLFTDKYPKPWLLPFGMFCTLSGIIMLSLVSSFPALLAASALTGLGSATFHPDASRIARMASGGRFGFAQSTFQVGGNTGTAIGPLLAAAVVVKYGLPHVAWFALFAVAGLFILYRVSLWYSLHLLVFSTSQRKQQHQPLPRNTVIMALSVLAMMVFSKYVYTASLTNYYTFYLIEKFDVSIASSQLFLFAFLAAVAAGTFIGGPVGDRIGRKTVIWFSILGVTPFTLMLPYTDLFWTCTLSIIIGLIMSSAFSAIVVYAQELIPGKVGLISGIFFGLMFGVSGIAAALLGQLADSRGIFYVYEICAYLPLLGVLAIFLPDTRKASS